MKKKKQKKKKGHGPVAHDVEYFGALAVILNARSCPIHECLINPEWKEQGLAQILLSRRQPNGSFVLGVYLVDILCLGLKDAFCNANIPLADYEMWTARIYRASRPLNCPVPLAHEIIYGAIEYASRLGFRPHSDFELAKHVLEAEDTQWAERAGVEFGRDGKPLFIAGPNDNTKLILKKLEENVGPGNFHFLVPFE